MTKIVDPSSLKTLDETEAVSTENVGGPTIVEFLLLLGLATVFSFRFIALLGLAALFVVLYRSRTKWLRWVTFHAAFASFLLPIDVRTTNTTMHHGQSDTVVSILPVFTGHHTAHSMIRRKHPEYYTSLIVNRPRWVISVDPSQL